MYDLIAIDFDSEVPTVSGRELHKALDVKTPYHKWFPRMCEYGFAENIDFQTVDKIVRRTDGTIMPQTETDHKLKIPMAKELCMLQRNEKGKQFRQYFISVEEMWNSPEMIMKRALQIANANVDRLMLQNAVQQQQIAEMKPKVSYYDIVLNCKDLMTITAIAKDYGWSAARMNVYLHSKGVQYKQSDIWFLYQKYAEKGYTSTKTNIYYTEPDGTAHSKVHTYWTQAGRLFIYELMKSDGILPLIEKED